MKKIMLNLLNINNTTVNGVLVKQAKNGNPLHVADLQSGIYFIKVQVANQVLNYKFMKK